MGLRDLLFINEEDGDKTGGKSENKPATKPTSFPIEFPKEAVASGFDFSFQTNPTATPVIPSASVSSVDTSKEVMDITRNMYQKGFDSLNQAGYDFYEFSKAMEQAGLDNPQMYVMAFTMAQAMDPSITKERLIQSADFYIQKINEAHQNFASQGQSRLQSVESQKHDERSSLEGELQNLQEQLNALQIQINDRKQKLSQIDSKYLGHISETRSKIQANDVIKTEFVSKLTKIRSGITNNLK